MKTYKVWIETEVYDSKTDEYTRGNEPLDLEVNTLTDATRLQETLHGVAINILLHYGGQNHADPIRRKHSPNTGPKAGGLRDAQRDSSLASGIPERAGGSGPQSDS